MRVGLYGGSFDPIHNGHIRPVWEAKRELGLERVIYLPTANPPHKDGVVAPPFARYSMVELALLWEQGLDASPYEIGRDVAYTIDTIRHFRDTRPDDELVLLVGGDSFAQLDRWREWRAILETVEIGVMVRPGSTLAEIRERISPELREAVFEETLDKGVHFVDNHPIMASSTAIRELLATGRSLPPGLVPSLVLDYVRKYELYR